MRILIVEDDQSIVRMLERVLSAPGYQCVSVEDGELGVSLAVDDTVGLVLLDLWLPSSTVTRYCAASGVSAPTCRC